jgi:hypothetical protein
MRRRLLLALIAALAAFFGATAVAQASTSASQSVPHHVAAAPGTWAAKYGAPFCDDRAASSYAAEPTPPVVDAGDVHETSEPAPRIAISNGCDREAVSTGTAHRAPSRDELRLRAPDARAAATLPTIPPVVEAVESSSFADRRSVDGARDEHRDADNPPPKPIPWRV